METTEQSFNAITVDGDTSTNDMVLLLANGSAKNEYINNENNDAYHTFQEALNLVTRQLAKMIVQDAEGATKFIEICVHNARNRKEAKHIAYTIAESPLVKTSFYGERCLWGRILAAIGYSGISINPEQVDLSYDQVKVVENGIGTGREQEASRLLTHREITITVDLKMGRAKATIWTSDLSKEYVNINRGYS